jgi:hypothetical protein
MSRLLSPPDICVGVDRLTQTLCDAEYPWAWMPNIASSA